MFENLHKLNILFKIICTGICIIHVESHNQKCQMPLQELKYIKSALDYMPPVQLQLNRDTPLPPPDNTNENECNQVINSLKHTINAMPDVNTFLNKLLIFNVSDNEIEIVLQRDYAIFEELRIKKRTNLMSSDVCATDGNNNANMLCNLKDSNHMFIHNLKSHLIVDDDKRKHMNCSLVVHTFRKFFADVLKSFRQIPRSRLQKHFNSEDVVFRGNAQLLYRNHSRIIEKLLEDHIEIISHLFKCQNYELASHYFEAAISLGDYNNVVNDIIYKEDFEILGVLELSLILPSTDQNKLLEAVVKILDSFIDSPQRIIFHYYMMKYQWRFENEEDIEPPVRQILSVWADQYVENEHLSTTVENFITKYSSIMDNYIGVLIKKIYVLQDDNFSVTEKFITQRFLTNQQRKIAYESFLEEMSNTINVNPLHVSDINLKLSKANDLLSSKNN